MRYYLAGPMSGLPKFNFPKFEETAAWLRSEGYEVVSAHEVDYGETEETRGGKPYVTYVRGDLKAMLECDAVIFLPGWQSSRGCHIERNVAKLVEMQLFVVVPASPISKRHIREIR